MAQTKVKYGHYVYDVDKENGTVTCTLESELELIKGTVFSDFFTTVGVARCHEVDKFDETIGKHIALTKAQANAFKKAARLYQEEINDMYECIKDFKRLKQNCINVSRKCNKHIREIDERNQ